MSHDARANISSVTDSFDNANLAALARFENTIREFSIDNRGLSIGPPVDNFHGVLSGIPQLVGDRSPWKDASP